MKKIKQSKFERKRDERWKAKERSQSGLNEALKRYGTLARLLARK